MNDWRPRVSSLLLVASALGAPGCNERDYALEASETETDDCGQQGDGDGNEADDETGETGDDQECGMQGEEADDDAEQAGPAKPRRPRSHPRTPQKL